MNRQTISRQLMILIPGVFTSCQTILRNASKINKIFGLPVSIGETSNKITKVLYNNNMEAPYLQSKMIHARTDCTNYTVNVKNIVIMYIQCQRVQLVFLAHLFLRFVLFTYRLSLTFSSLTDTDTITQELLQATVVILKNRFSKLIATFSFRLASD